ncbi:pentatricopeptide repeat-containing protein [Perkinsela sp. CCAP 1560/4]|nr:pentatricopeptide repeat-containing protein [Perkinsela sp. CCAP 1560/4]|eukprot:KNH08066.1 pentatricopeptide repeat-containing protein [Perkinsela sp. CCAP 1560/4]
MNVLLHIAYLSASEDHQGVAPVVRETQTWGEWIGGGSAGYIYNSYRSNFEMCPMGKACVGACFRKDCKPFEVGNGAFVRGTFCQSITDEYIRVQGESAYYNSMATCRNGDYLIGISQGNFTVFSSFRAVCAKGSPRLYADHKRAVMTNAFCPQNYVAVGRCYETSGESCREERLKCAPLVRTGFNRSGAEVLHKIVGSPGTPSKQAGVRNVHPLSVSLAHPQAIAICTSPKDGELVTIVDGTNKIVQTSLLSLDGRQNPFVFRTAYSRVISKSDFHRIAASPSHLFYASTSNGVSRIYRTNLVGERLMHVLGGEVGVDLKERILCKPTFLKYDERENSLLIGQPHGYLKWDFKSSSIETIGSPVCRIAESSTEKGHLDTPRCIFSRRNQTFVVDTNGLMHQACDTKLISVANQPVYLSVSKGMKFTSCTYDPVRDFIFLSLDQCIIAYSLQKDFPEEIHIAGRCSEYAKISPQDDVFRQISQLTVHNGMLLAVDSGTNSVYALEHKLSSQQPKTYASAGLEKSPVCAESSMTQIGGQFSSPIVDIKQFLHGDILIVLKNDLLIFSFQGDQLSRKLGGEIHFEGKTLEDTFHDISMASVRDYVIYFADNTKKGIYAADIRTRTVRCLDNHSLRELHVEDMMLIDDGKQLCVISRYNAKVSLHAIQTSTGEIRMLHSSIDRYLPREGKYSMANFRESVVISCGRRVVLLRKSKVESHLRIVGEFPLDIRRIAVDLENDGLLMLCSNNTVLRVSLNEKSMPRTNAVLMFQSETLSPLLGIAFHDEAGNILLSDAISIHHVSARHTSTEYTPSNAVENDKDRISWSSKPSKKTLNHGSVHFEGDLNISVFQLLDDGERDRPQIDVVIHGDSWRDDRLTDDPAAFLTSVLPETVFSPAIIASSRVIVIDPHRARIIIGFDHHLNLSPAYTQVVLKYDFPEALTESGKRPLANGAMLIPRVKILHGSKLLVYLRYIFVIFAVISISSAHPTGYIFLALTQARFVQPAIRCMTKPSIHIWSPMYTTLAEATLIPPPMSRIISTAALLLLLLPMLYSLDKWLSTRGSSPDKPLQRILFHHIVCCAISFVHTALSHAAYIGMFTKPSFFWIGYFAIFHAALSFILYGASWLRKSQMTWKEHHLLPDGLIPTGIWNGSLNKLSWRGFFYADFNEACRLTKIPLLVYYQLILVCAAMKSSAQWAYLACTSMSIILSCALSIFYLARRPTRWKLLSLVRGITLNAICLFLLLDIGGSNELMTALSAMAVMLLCSAEGIIEVMLVWRESTLWNKMAN